MYHRLCSNNIAKQCWFAVTASLALGAMPVYAAPTAGEPIVTHCAEISWLRLPNVKDIKNEPDKVYVYKVDDTPLGNRQPLLLVHGLRGELWPNKFRYEKLVAFLAANPRFNERYKIFLARYNSYLPLAPVSEEFKQTIHGLSQQAGGKKVSIVALSMGGNIVAQAMTDATTDACVDRVLTLGTPFHGSPLFTSSWMQLSMMRWHKTPFTQLDTALPYHIYFSKHTNLLADLNWDDSDSMIPDVGDFRVWFRRGEQHLSPRASRNLDVLKFNADGKINKKKFIVYGGYLQMAASQGPEPWWRGALRAPSWFTTTIVPEHAGKEHAVLRSLNVQMAHALVPPTASKTTAEGYVYGLNDGITPLTSSLFLPNDAMKKLVVNNQNAVNGLKGITDVGRARVFAGIDHLTFIDQYNPHGGSDVLKDQLSDAEPGKTIFSWILDDLLNTLPGANPELAVDSK
jgi:pimeloyl-ACP methyl ester carboxylesterase